MDDAWHAAWHALSCDQWQDAMALATWVAGEAGVEVETARKMLYHAARNGVLCVRHRVRSTPRRLHADYRVRPRMADSYEESAADLVQRFLRAHGRRDAFHPKSDLDSFHEWLRNVGQHKPWRRYRTAPAWTPTRTCSPSSAGSTRAWSTPLPGVREGWGSFQRHLPRGF
jgi:hypothetical protein